MISYKLSHGHTDRDGRRTGKHTEPIRMADSNGQMAYKTTSVNDAYTRDNEQPENRGRPTRAAMLAVSWSKGRSIQELIADGLENWQ